MKQRSIARKYASVLMKIARDDSDLNKIESELNSFSEILETSPKIKKFLIKPVISKARKLELILNTCQKANFLTLTKKFLTVLAEKERLEILEDILQSLKLLKDEKNNIIAVEVITASKLNSDLEEKIISLFSSKLNKDIKLCIKVDPSIVGGMITKVGSVIYDGSIRGQLLRIKEKIMRE